MAGIDPDPRPEEGSRAASAAATASQPIRVNLSESICPSQPIRVDFEPARRDADPGGGAWAPEQPIAVAEDEEKRRAQETEIRYLRIIGISPISRDRVVTLGGGAQEQPIAVAVNGPLSLVPSSTHPPTHPPTPP